TQSAADRAYFPLRSQGVMTETQGEPCMTRPFAVLAATTLAAAPVPALAQDAPAWIEQSNAYTMQLLEMEAQFQPEGASQTGLEQYDGLAMDLGPGLSERYISAARTQLAELQA